MGCPSIEPGAEQNAAVMLRAACYPSQTIHPTPHSPRHTGYRPPSTLSAFVSLAMKCWCYVAYCCEAGQSGFSYRTNTKDFPIGLSSAHNAEVISLWLDKACSVLHEVSMVSVSPHDPSCSSPSLMIFAGKIVDPLSRVWIFLKHSGKPNWDGSPKFLEIMTLPSQENDKYCPP